jgi:hypothetical protein
MTFVPTTPSLGFPRSLRPRPRLSPPCLPVAARPVPTSATVIRAVDPVYGNGEFIYLLGVASTVVGSVVTWRWSVGAPTWQTALAPSTAGLAQPLAVAMSINLATFYGWYQISGMMVMATNGTLATGPAAIYLAGSGQVTSTQANGKQVLNAINVTATGTPSTGLAVVEGDRIFAQGQVV